MHFMMIFSTSLLKVQTLSIGQYFGCILDAIPHLTICPKMLEGPIPYHVYESSVIIPNRNIRELMSEICDLLV